MIQWSRYVPLYYTVTTTSRHHVFRAWLRSPGKGMQVRYLISRDSPLTSDVLGAIRRHAKRELLHMESEARDELST